MRTEKISDANQATEICTRDFHLASYGTLDSGRYQITVNSFAGRMECRIEMDTCEEAWSEFGRLGFKRVGHDA